jgi:hypothetical protein
MGSCRRGLAPWVILADGPGGLFMPGFARARCHGDGTPTRSDASGTKAATDVLPGVSRYPVARLIFRRASSARSGAGVSLPALPCSHSGAGSTGTRWSDPGSGGRLVGSSADAARESWYKTVRSVVEDRTESDGHSRQRPSVRYPVSAGWPWPAAAHRRERASVSAEVADAVSMIWRGWPPRPLAAVDPQRPVCAASSLVGRTRQVSDAVALARFVPHLSAQVPRFMVLPRGPGRPRPSRARMSCAIS